MTCHAETKEKLQAGATTQHECISSWWMPSLRERASLPLTPPLNKGHPLEGWLPLLPAVLGLPLGFQCKANGTTTTGPHLANQTSLRPTADPYPRSGQLWVPNTDSCWDKWVRWLPVPHELFLRQEWAAIPSSHHTTFLQISGLARGDDTLHVYFQNFL